MKSFSKQLSIIFLIVILSKIVEAVQRLIISYKFGISDYSDIYWALINIPDYIIILSGFATLNGVVNSQYSELYAKGDKEILADSFSNLFSILFIVGILISAFIIIFNNIIVKALLPGFNDEKYLKAISVALIIFPIFFLKAFSVFFTSALNSVKSFSLPASLQMLLPVIVIISVFIPYINDKLIYNLSYSNLIGNFLIFVVLFFILKNKIKGFRLKIPEMDNATKQILLGCGATFFPVLSQQFFILSKNFFASQLEEGAISTLYYSGFISGIVSIIIFTSSFNLILNKLTVSFTLDFKAKTKLFFSDILLTILFYLMPVIMFFLLFNHEIINLVYMRGNFTAADIDKTTLPFIWDSLSLFNYVIYILHIALLLSKKKYKTISYIGVPVFLLGILLNYLLSKYVGYYGISISNFVITFIYVLSFLYISRKIYGHINELLIKISKLVLSSLIIFIVIYFIKYNSVFTIVSSNQLIDDVIKMVIYFIAATGLYFLVSYLFKVNYLYSLFKLLPGLKSKESV